MVIFLVKMKTAPPPAVVQINLPPAHRHTPAYAYLFIFCINFITSWWELLAILNIKDNFHGGTVKIKYTNM